MPGGRGALKSLIFMLSLFIHGPLSKKPSGAIHTQTETTYREKRTRWFKVKESYIIKRLILKSKYVILLTSKSIRTKLLNSHKNYNLL